MDFGSELGNKLHACNPPEIHQFQPRGETGKKDNIVSEPEIKYYHNLGLVQVRHAR